MKMTAVIKSLKEKGFKIEYRVRTDGGVIITKINNMKFTGGAGGNIYARDIQGITLSEAKMSQVQYNVKSYIKVGKGKKKPTLDEEMKKELRKVQRIMRKTKVNYKVSAKKVKWHIENEGRKAALKYLKAQERHGQGLAYSDNVRYLAIYIEDVARGCSRDKELQNRLFKLAELVRSKEILFKESWIEKCYQELYKIVQSHYDSAVGNSAVDNLEIIIR